MSEPSYWSSLLSNRVARRRFIQVVAGSGAAAGAISLIGCGGDGDGGAKKQPEDKSGLVSKAVDTSSQAKAGGVLPLYETSDTPGFDGLTNASSIVNRENAFAYSLLIGPKVFNKAKGEGIATGVDPETAESYEVSPDGLQLTFKIRPNMKFD